MMSQPVASRTHAIDISLVAMPCWTAKQPSHALSIVGALAKASGLSYAVTDLNIRFFRHVDTHEQSIWDESVINLWLGDVAERLWHRHEGWLHQHLEEILAASPKVVAFTVNMWTRYFSVRAARYIKRRAPDTVILFGGVDCFVGEHNLAFLRDGDCDILCQGEAEIAFPKFLAALRKDGWRTRVPGFAYRDEDGKIIDTGRVELPTLKSPQPPSIIEEFDLSLYGEPGRAPFFFSRGCPFTCRFCSETTNFSKFRSRDPSEAFHELTMLIRPLRAFADPPTLDFSDSIFNAHINNLLAFSHLIIDSGIKVHMGAQGHFHHTMTKEVIETLAQAGFTRIFWGFESGSQKVIDLMKKAFHLTDAIRIIKDCSNAGIYQYLPILVGFPGETPDDFADTVEFIIRYRDTPRLVFFQPSPVLVRTNAELHERYMDFGLANNEVLHWQDTAQTNTYMVRLARCFVAAQAQGNPSLSRENVACGEYLAQNINASAVAIDLFFLLNSLYQRSGSLETFATRIAHAYDLARRPGTRLQSLFGRLISPDGVGGMVKSLVRHPGRLKRIGRFLRRRTQAVFAKLRVSDSGSAAPITTSPVASSDTTDASASATAGASPHPTQTNPLLEQWLSIDKNSLVLREEIIAMTLDALKRLQANHRSRSSAERGATAVSAVP